MMQVNEKVQIANSEHLQSLADALPEATKSLLALLALRAMNGYQLTVWLPEPMAAYKARQEGSLLLSAEVGGLTGGIMLRRSDAGAWDATVHT